MLTIFQRHSKGHYLIILLLFPLAIFALLKVSPHLNIQAWSISWYTGLVQFYAGSLASLIALIAALFIRSSSGEEVNPRTLFITFAFVNMSALFLISSIATPDILISNNEGTFNWSLRFAFPAGAVFFFLANIRWSDRARLVIAQYYRVLWIMGGVILTLYVIAAFGFLEVSRTLSRYISFLPNGLAIGAISLLLISAWRTKRIDWSEDSQINDDHLAIVLVLLAEAQLFQTFGRYGRFDWLLHHPVMLVALMVAIFAIISTLQASGEIKFNRYFAALGSILVAGLSLLIGELGTHWITGGVNRTLVVPLILVQGALNFFVLYFIVVYLDKLIEERTAALRHEEHLRSELTQLIVHDLKSPLSVITSGINLLNKGNLGSLSVTQTRLLANLEQSGEHILQMIDDLLDVERLEGGKLNLQESTVNLVTMLREAVDDLQIVASPHKQSLTLTPAAGIPCIRVDKRLLWRVINNLIGNALKFTPENGRVNISADVVDSYLEVSFADNGPGIPEEERERIFEKFAQVKGSERRGAGLGLTFCKMVVEAHGGTLVVGESDLGGALFQMRLPLPPPPDEAESSISPRLTERDLKLEAS